LLLDEPTNHLDVLAREWLEARLEAMPAACAIVSHDRVLLNRVATRTFEILRGAFQIHNVGFEEHLDTKAEEERRAWGDYSAQQRRMGAGEEGGERGEALARKVATPPAGVKSSQDFYNRKAAKVARTGRLLRERRQLEPEMAKPWEEASIPALD